MSRFDISLSARKVALVLLFPVLVLAGLTIPMELAEHSVRPVSWTAADMFRRFTLNSESSIPAWFSTVLLLGAGCLLVFAGMFYRSRDDRWWKHWTALGALFGLLSLDEAIGLHETLMAPMSKLVSAEGIFHFAWVIPGAIVVAVLGLAWLPFLWNLEKTTRNRFIAAACLFVGGALGLEMVGGLVLESFGEYSIAYMLTTTVEETCEMLGMVVFISSIIAHLSREISEIRLTLSPAPP